MVLEHHQPLTPLGPTTWFFWHKLPGRGALFVLECLPILLVTALSIREGARARGIWNQHRAELAAFVALLAGCVLGVVANGQFNYHYFIQLTPPLALLSAPLFAAIWSGERAPRARYLAPRFLARWVGVAALAFLITDAIGLAQNRGPLQERSTSAIIRRRTTGSSCGVRGRRRPGSTWTRIAGQRAVTSPAFRSTGWCGG